MLIKKSIDLYRFFNSLIVLTKSSFQLMTSLSSILHITVIIFSDFQSKLELLIPEKVLPFTDEVIVFLVHKCSQQLQLLALNLEILRYILGLLKGFGYLRKTGDLIGDNLTRRLLQKLLVLYAPCRSTDDTENKFRGLILTVGNKVRKI